MRRIDTLARRPEERSVFPTVPWSQVVQWITDGVAYAGLAGSHPEQLSDRFDKIVSATASRYGLVAAAIAARAFPLSQLRPTWRRFNDGTMFGDRSLTPLERPSVGTLPAFLISAEWHASLAGAVPLYRRRDRGLRILRPDWLRTMWGSQSGYDDAMFDLDAEVVGHLYFPGGVDSGRDPVSLSTADVSVWLPEPNPLDGSKGMSWVQSVVREISLDSQATDHLSKFFDNAATPNVVYSMDPQVTDDQLKDVTEQFRRRHEGVNNAYKSIVMRALSDVTVIGTNIKDLDLKGVQGGLETRVASRSRVPAVVLGLREGMQGSALNSGNYGASRRMWADTFVAPYMQSFCAAVEPLLGQAGDVELTYDPDAVLLFQEDQKDAADINATKAQAIRTLVDAGFDPQTVVKAIDTGKLADLAHSGLMSVQLLPPGQGTTDE